MSAPHGRVSYGCMTVRMRSPRAQCNLASRRRWWWWHRWGYLPCTSQSLPAYSGRLHPAGCCPASSPCRARGKCTCAPATGIWIKCTNIQTIYLKCFSVLVHSFCAINTVQDSRKQCFNGWLTNWRRAKMEAGEKLKWMVLWWKEIEGGLWDKSGSVERWQGWSWMQPLWAWWLIATKMSTFHPCSQCNRSTRSCC